jgi:hypothetical protein
MDPLFEWGEKSWNIFGSYLTMVNGLPNLEGMGLSTGFGTGLFPFPFKVVCSTVVIKEDIAWLPN